MKLELIGRNQNLSDPKEGLQLMSRKEREKEFRRGLILEAARELFAEASFEKVTVDDIARRAQFGKGTIYQYFASKEEILVDVLCEGLAGLCEAMKDNCAGRTDPEQVLTTMIRLQYEFYCQNTLLFLSLVRKSLDGDLPEELMDRVREINQVRLGIITGLLAGASELGWKLPGAPGEVAHAIDNTCKGLALSAVEGGGRDRISGRLVSQMLLFGIMGREEA